MRLAAAHVCGLLLCGVLAAGLSDRQARAAPDDASAKPAAVEAAQGPLPSDPQALVAFVTTAMRDHDQAAFERLVNWDGVRPLRKRLTLLQIATGYGRPIKEAVVEDFPPDGLDEAQARGTFKVNMPVSKRLRITFADGGEGGGAADDPVSVFLVGEKDGAFRIAVLNSVGQQRK